MLCRVLNRQGVSVACVVFLSGRTNEEGGSGRGVHDRTSAEFNKMAEATACRRLLRGEHNIKPRNQRRFCREKSAFCVRKVGFDASIWIRIRGAVYFFVVRDSFFVVLRSLASAGRLKDRVLLRVEKWKRRAKINNK